jgi:hypothetical protein
MSYETTAPAAPNLLPNAVPDAGAGVVGGRSNPPYGRNGNIRNQGDNLNTRLPNGQGATLTGSAGAVVSDNPPAGNDATQLAYDAPPVVGMTGGIGDGSAVVTLDGDGANNSSRTPGRYS